MQVLTVNLDDRSYPIYIGEQLLSTPELLTRHIRGKQVCIITNDTVAPLYLDALVRGFDFSLMFLHNRHIGGA